MTDLTNIYDLPEPDEPAKARSLALINMIKETILDQGGSISFSHFMRLALYHPAFGYYSSDNLTIGKSGDFTTAPEISPLFGKCLANQFITTLQNPDTRHVLELGPGSGKLACDLLTHWKEHDCVPDKYYLYEISHSLREKQRLALRALHPDLSEKLVWLETLPTTFSGIIIGNEILDALPFDCFVIENNECLERRVGWENEQFAWVTLPAPKILSDPISQLALANGYASEFNNTLPGFIKGICDSLQSGIAIFIDYGYGQREYYHPQRSTGTLTCFYRHRKHANPLIMPGLQDITAHVDFTRVIEYASEYGCTLAGFTTQAGFLLGNDLLAFAADMEKGLSPKSEFELHQAVKTLTLPTEMGEVIKVMAFGKKIGEPLASFKLQDRRRDL